MNDHWLVIPEDPRDDIEVEHGDCPTGPGQYSSPGHEYTEYTCHVENYTAELGLPWRHQGTDPEAWHDTEPLAPGRYRIEYWAEQMHPSGPWGSAEYDCGLRIVEGHPALLLDEEGT